MNEDRKAGASGPPAWRALCALPLMLGCLTAKAEPAVTRRAVDLLAQAQSDAALLAALSKDTKVEILARKGAWSQVRTAAGQTGWVRMLSLQGEAQPDAAAPAQAAANPLAGLGTLLSSGRTENTATVTTGVRGLSEEDIQNAQAKPDELEKLKQFTADQKTAQAYAVRSKLTPAKIEYMAAPAAPASPPSNEPGYSGG
jgi:hypothetical protein